MDAWEYNYVSTTVTTWSAESLIEAKYPNSLWVFKTVLPPHCSKERYYLYHFDFVKGQVKDQ